MAEITTHPATALALCEHEADNWMVETRMPNMIAGMTDNPELRANLEAFVHLAFVEGAYRGATNAEIGRRLTAEEIDKRLAAIAANNAAASGQ